MWRDCRLREPGRDRLGSCQHPAVTWEEEKKEGTRLEMHGGHRGQEPVASEEGKWRDRALPLGA